MMRLYFRRDCPFCWKVRIALHELAVPYEAVTTRLGEKHPDVLRLNPNGTVPVLVAGDLVLWESNTILEYLEDRFGPGLLPTDPAARARARSLVNYADSVIGPCLRPLIFERRAKPRQEWDEAVIAESLACWRRCLDHLEKELGAQEWFVGRVSFAECALVPRFGLAARNEAGVGPQHPRLQRWYEAFRRRPSFCATAPGEG